MPPRLILINKLKVLIVKLKKLFQSTWDNLLISNNLQKSEENCLVNTKKDPMKILISGINSKTNILDINHFICSAIRDVKKLGTYTWAMQCLYTS